MTSKHLHVTPVRPRPRISTSRSPGRPRPGCSRPWTFRSLASTGRFPGMTQRTARAGLAGAGGSTHPGTATSSTQAGHQLSCQPRPGTTTPNTRAGRRICRRALPGTTTPSTRADRQLSRRGHRGRRTIPVAAAGRSPGPGTIGSGSGHGAIEGWRR